MIATLFYFILALFILVTVHEYGHFLVARLCGIKVLRFSFGFGKIIASRRDKKGTEYAWSLFPLGGYVKMLDETEGEVDPAERHLAFNRQPVWKRILVVIAGPLFNFIFAFFALWLVALIGIKTLAPIIGEVKPGSIASEAGLSSNEEIIALNDQPVKSWRDFQYALMPYIGSRDTVNITVVTVQKGQKILKMPLSDWKLDSKTPDLLASLGMSPFIPKIPPMIGEVAKDSPADKAGLKINDYIILVNNQPVDDWLRVVEYVKKYPGKPIDLLIKREGKIKSIQFQIGIKKDKTTEGYIGLASKNVAWSNSWLRVQREGVIDAIPLAMKQTWYLSQATFILIGRLVIGHLDLNSISGPVGIAQGAGDSARGGLVYYLSFLALVSISLGVLNLLPVPMLDGGHLLYYLLEIMIGRPLADSFKTVGVYIGLALLGILMFVALKNDISRLLQ